MFNQLPHEMNREIGRFLDYNSRINFFQVLPDREDKFVRKLNSDSHNLAVKIDLVRVGSDIIYNSKTPRKSAIFMTKLFRHLAKTKDTCLIDACYSSSMQNTIIDKALTYSDSNNPEYLNLSQKVKKDLVYASKLLMVRWLEHVPKKKVVFKNEVVKII